MSYAEAILRSESRDAGSGRWIVQKNKRSASNASSERDSMYQYPEFFIIVEVSSASGGGRVSWEAYGTQNISNRHIGLMEMRKVRRPCTTRKVSKNSYSRRAIVYLENERAKFDGWKSK